MLPPDSENMKKLFSAIRSGELNTVKAILEKEPALIACTAKQPPKKDDGQSPLQVAIKSGQFEIANYLLDCGADVNFMEAENCANPWRMPVLQDAVRAAVFSCRSNTVHPDGIVSLSTKEQADTAYLLMKRMVDMGANIDCCDSFGNSCLMRAILDARQILPAGENSEVRRMTQELQIDMERIFRLLHEAGVDFEEIDRNWNKPIRELYTNEPVGAFLQM